MIQINCDKSHAQAEGACEYTPPAIARVVLETVITPQDLCAEHLKEFFTKDFKAKVTVIPINIIIMMTHDVGRETRSK